MKLFKPTFLKKEKINYIKLNNCIIELKNHLDFLKEKNIILHIKKYDYIYFNNIFLSKFNLITFKKQETTNVKKNVLNFFSKNINKIPNDNTKQQILKYLKNENSCFHVKTISYLETLNYKFNYLYKHQDLYWYLIQNIFQIFKLNKFYKFLELPNNKENFYLIFNHYLEDENTFSFNFTKLKKLYIEIYPLDEDEIHDKINLKEIFLFYFLLNLDSVTKNLNEIDKKNPLLFFTVYDYYRRYSSLIKIKNNFNNINNLKNYLTLENKNEIYKQPYDVISKLFIKNLFKPVLKMYKQQFNKFLFILLNKFKNLNKNLILKNNVIFLKFLRKLKKLNNINYKFKKFIVNFYNLNIKINKLKKLKLNKSILHDLYELDQENYFKLINFYNNKKYKKKINYLNFIFANNKKKTAYNFFNKFESSLFLNFSFYNLYKGLGKQKNKLKIYYNNTSNIIKNLKCLYALNNSKQIITKKLNYKMSFYMNSLKKKLYNDFFLHNNYKTIYKKLVIIELFKNLYEKKTKQKYGNIIEEINQINNNELLISNKAINILMKKGKKELIRKKMNTVYFLLRSVYGIAKPRSALELVITKHKPIVKLKKHRKSGKDYLVPYPIYSQKHQIFMSYKIFFNSLKEYNIKNFAKKFPQYFALEIFLSLFDHRKSHFLKKIKEHNYLVSKNRGYIRFLKEFK